MKYTQLKSQQKINRKNGMPWVIVLDTELLTENLSMIRVPPRAFKKTWYVANMISQGNYCDNNQYGPKVMTKDSIIAKRRKKRVKKTTWKYKQTKKSELVHLSSKELTINFVSYPTPKTHTIA